MTSFTTARLCCFVSRFFAKPTLAMLTAVTLYLPASSQAFKMGIHDDITRTELTALNFDEDSADEVADSNYWTDLFEATSDAAHADNNQLGAASRRMTLKMETIGTSLVACKRRKALDTLGEALHTAQDIFAHSNSVDNGFPIADLLGLSDGTAACDPARNFAPGGLVTGYFSLGNFFTGNQCRGMQVGMCCHRDLNKDNASQPNGARHPAAVAAARAATQAYFGLVENEIRTKYPTQAAQLIKMLKRKQRTHYFVIDDTGSMGGDIDGVKAAVNAYLDSLVAGDEAPTLGLVSFKDAPVLYGDFCDITAFRTAVNSLSASGGGDCPEASNAGLLTALYQFPTSDTDIRLKSGRVLLATDASAGDASLGPVVASEAIARGVSIDAILTGDCVAETAAVSTLSVASSTTMPVSYNDPVAAARAAALPSATVAAPMAISDPLTSPSARTQLRALTAQTGGVLFQVTRAEVAQVVPALIEMGDPQSATLAARRLSLTAGTPVTIDIPVDETVTKTVTFMVALTRAGVLPTVNIIRPDGRIVALTDADVKRLLLSSVDNYSISAPATGVWRVQLAGNASVVARAYGASALDINALRFVDLNPRDVRPEVEFVPLEGLPIVGTNITADLRLTLRPTVDSIRLIRDDGTVLQTLVPQSADKRYFRVNFTVPSEVFAFEVVGHTIAGNAFIRQIALPVLPQTIALSVSPRTAEALVGSSATFKVTVRNSSTTAATYKLTALSDLGWLTSVPAPFNVPNGGSVTVDVAVQVPAGASDGAQSSISIVVEDVAQPTSRNGTKVSVTALTNRSPVCSTATAQPAALWPPNHKMANIAIGGVTDPDNNLLAITVTGITQDEPVNGEDDGHTAPDGSGVGTAAPAVRAERSEEGNGRVYAISFKADDGRGGSCQGIVNVGVPKKRNGSAVDSGQRYDATVVPPGFKSDDDDDNDIDEKEDRKPGR